MARVALSSLAAGIVLFCLAVPVVSSSATTGSLFLGRATRKYVRPASPPLRPGIASTTHRSHACTHYAVVTTIFEPSDAVAATCARLPDWCLVIVGDKKGPPAYPVSGPCAPIYLSASDQEHLARSSDFVAALPWNHFGRKNVGYLYAILHGASFVWDFDDDNELVVAASELVGRCDGHHTKTHGRTTTPARKSCKGTSLPPNHALVFNPYQALGATHFSWPRGFPLEQINNVTTHNAQRVVPHSYNPATIGVVQALANYNPDVDAIYRLTRELPLDFEGGIARPLILPEQTYTPFNGQATLFHSVAAWSLYLPVTVHGRVSDIWRSYIGQRLMWDAGLKLAFDGPWVKQVRNEHRIIADLDSETFMYLRTEALIRFLSEWKSTAPTMAQRIVELYTALYEREYVEHGDVTNIEHWVRELQGVGYDFPPVVLGRNEG